MYRPNTHEENQLLSLTKWLETIKNRQDIPSYVIKEISSDINMSWTQIERRKELCSKNLEETQQYLLEKYQEQGIYSELLKNKLNDIKENIEKDIFDFYIRETESPITIQIYPFIKKRNTLLMLESGWVPSLFAETLLKVDYEDEANNFIEEVLESNKIYKELLKWYNEYKQSLNDEDKNNAESHIKFSVISDIKYALKKENPLKTVQDKLINWVEIDSKDNTFKDLIDDFFKPKKRPKEAAVLYPNQEKFYSNLETWASNIRNPHCSEWILNYLDKGRNLPFYKIHVFKFKYNEKKAQEYLIERYEQYLKYKHEKDEYYRKKNERYSKKHYKRDLKSFKRALKESGNQDFSEDENITYTQKIDNSPSYPFGYEGSYAHDVAGLSNDDIDTILEGDPDAYWNID